MPVGLPELENTITAGATEKNDAIFGKMYSIKITKLFSGWGTCPGVPPLYLPLIEKYRNIDGGATSTVPQ